MAASAGQVEIPGIDARAVTAWMLALPIGARGPISFASAAHGKSNITVLATDADGRRWILRRPPMGQLLQSAHDVAREHRILSALQSTTVPSPDVVALSTDPAVTDAPLVLMEHVEGLVVHDLETAESLSGELRGAIAHGMVGALAAIHAVDLEATGLIDLASHKSYAHRQLKRWSAQWEASRTRELPQVDELARRLQRAAPEQSELALVHGDFHLRNVIVDPESGQARAVLDWELCTLGDPLADLGGLLAYWHEASDPPNAPFPASALPGFPARRELAAAYGALTGRDLSTLGFWHVLALWKIAVILEGVRRRALDDPRNAARGATADSATVDSLVDLACATADEVGL